MNGNNKHRDQLINHDSPNVRRSVAQYGTDDHRDKLIGDQNEKVRHAVAQFGNVHQTKTLINDHDYGVSMTAHGRNMRLNGKSFYDKIHNESTLTKIRNLLS